MSTIQVRISENTHATIRDIAREAGETLQSVVEKAVDRYKRELFLQRLNGDFETLKNDEGAWSDELAERELWDATLAEKASKS